MAHINTAQINFAGLTPAEWPIPGSWIVGFDTANGLLSKIDSDGLITIIEGNPMRIKRTLVTPEQLALMHLPENRIIALPEPSALHGHIIRGITHKVTYGSVTPNGFELVYNHPIINATDLAIWRGFGYFFDQVSFGTTDQLSMYSDSSAQPILPGTKNVIHLMRPSDNSRAQNFGTIARSDANVSILTEDLKLQAIKYPGNIPLVTDAVFEIFVAYNRVRFDQ